MDAVLSNRLRVSRSLGEQRGELQGSFAIHDILKDKIAFLSGNIITTFFSQQVLDELKGKGGKNDRVHHSFRALSLCVHTTTR